ncbi:HvfB family MNIO-type RiPP peptide maturase [Rheinheimera fenheensis]|uniref:HvfB family MNIO-type RiPP peptide maturase n=1 Tax=Rheinheimera fenheensis TaxID=3152295 RepID=UPI00325DCB24
MKSTNALTGSGLGLRREMLPQLLEAVPAGIDFFEVAPENWIPFGGKLQKQFRQLTEQQRFICHGLSLSIGSPDPLDVIFLKQVKQFLREHNILLYSEHLSYCSGGGHLYDLMPIPFTEEAVHYVAKRIRQVQDILEQPLILENVSYYAAPGQQMSEQDFTLAVLTEADCQLLLDVNNIYVNSVNHGYNAEAFLQAMPSARIAYYHIAGHFKQAEDLLIDTHGADVIDPVWQLLAKAYQQHGVKPTLLERDFNIPELAELGRELAQIKALQHAAQQQTLPLRA